MTQRHSVIERSPSARPQHDVSSHPDDRLPGMPRSAAGADDALRLLAAGIPLTLLIDLASTVDSAELYRREPGAADWLAPLAG